MQCTKEEFETCLYHGLVKSEFLSSSREVKVWEEFDRNPKDFNLSFQEEGQTSLTVYQRLSQTTGAVNKLSLCFVHVIIGAFLASQSENVYHKLRKQFVIIVFTYKNLNIYTCLL